MREEERRKFESLVQLADFRVMRWNARRLIDARISLAFWASIVAIVAFVDCSNHLDLLLSFLAVSVLVHAFMCCMPIAMRNHNDINWAFYYMERAEDIVNHNTKFREKPVSLFGVHDKSDNSRWTYPLYCGKELSPKKIFLMYIKSLTDWWARLEIAVSIALSVIVYFYFYIKKVSIPSAELMM